ncbi:unnamed protein product [Allacma fusca]|uniref:Uncharacterized protein n=1 Tax=Allacma fusca TaxID=39272 RepID=A0A8J2PXQ0_9HEXA|nr:unnamed protein product [Allacma fusca]
MSFIERSPSKQNNTNIPMAWTSSTEDSTQLQSSTLKRSREYAYDGVENKQHKSTDVLEAILTMKEEMKQELNEMNTDIMSSVEAVQTKVEKLEISLRDSLQQIGARVDDLQDQNADLEAKNEELTKNIKLTKRGTD